MHESVCAFVRERGTQIETASKLKCPLCWNLPDGTAQKKPGVLLPHTQHILGLFRNEAACSDRNRRRLTCNESKLQNLKKK